MSQVAGLEAMEQIGDIESCVVNFQQENAARAQHAMHLGERSCVVGVRQREAANSDVNAG
jgi:hypothetical protein